jgi:hypothetical protein
VDCKKTGDTNDRTFRSYTFPSFNTSVDPYLAMCHAGHPIQVRESD